MNRATVAVVISAVLLLCAVGAHAWPLNEDWGYGAYRQTPDGKCVPGATPLMSTTQWIINPTGLVRQPQKPWLKILVNGQNAGLGAVARFVDGPASHRSRKTGR